MSDTRDVVSTLLNEVLSGPAPAAAYFLNPGDAGLIKSLDRLSAAQASARAPGGGASIAAHVDHLRYGLELLNRWSRGEDPFADADFAASWRQPAVSEEEWARLRGKLRQEARAWLKEVGEPRERSGAELTGALGGIVHLAYHLGAIRQIDRTARGPAAND